MMKSNIDRGNGTGLLIAAGFSIGAGMLGGFVDGILLHQILQWHHTLTGVQPIADLSSLEANTLWDGLFLAGNWAITVVGIGLLWRAGGRSDVFWSGKIFGGSILLGAGLFNLVEGILDHQILGIHHVKTGPNQLAWDLGFLAFGALLVIAGSILLQSGKKDSSLTRG